MTDSRDGVATRTVSGDRERGACPLVSVVIPTYDRPAMLRSAVESVVEQTYRPIELIVVDDHSPKPAATSLPDGIQDAFHDVTVSRHDENRGSNVARTTGIRAANGDYVAFLDDDDRWEREKLDRQVGALEAADDNVAVAYTGTRYVDEAGEELLVTTPTVSGDVTRALLAGKSVEEFSTVLVRADVIDEAGLPDPDLPTWQDREWYLRLSRHCEFAAVSEPLTVRTMDHGDQISDQYEIKRDVSFPRILERHRSLAAEFGWRYERQFRASLLELLAWAALKNERYADARRHLFDALRCYPFSRRTYVYLLPALGGRRVHSLARESMRIIRAVTARISGRL